MSQLIVLLLVFSIWLLVMLLFAYQVVQALKRYVAVMTGITTDKAVDEFFRKAVILSCESHVKDKATGEELNKKIVERASAIMVDVLLQHGLSPRQYNLEGLVKVTMAKLGLISYKKGGE